MPVVVERKIMQVTIQIYEKNSAFGLPGQEPTRFVFTLEMESPQIVGELVGGLLSTVLGDQMAVETALYNPGGEEASEVIRLTFPPQMGDRFYLGLYQHLHRLPTAWSATSYRGAGKWLDKFIKLYDQHKKV